MSVALAPGRRWWAWAAGGAAFAAALAWLMSPAPVPLATARSGAFAEIQWADLIPGAWDPTKRYRALNLDALKDNDPRAEALLRDMRTTWDDAPTVGGLAGARVTLAGYVVPLDGLNGPAKEFLHSLLDFILVEIERLATMIFE